MLEQGGKFAMRDDEGRLLYTLGARDGGAFNAATLKEAAPDALTLTLDLPQAPDTRRSFESMSRLSQQLVTALEARRVDDNGQPLDERALAAIARQLDEVRAKLEVHGIVPGGALARRLFS